MRVFGSNCRREVPLASCAGRDGELSGKLPPVPALAYPTEKLIAGAADRSDLPRSGPHVYTQKQPLVILRNATLQIVTDIL